jgi:hypothetical protein
MDTYRVVPVGIGQWAVERTSENISSDLLPHFSLLQHCHDGGWGLLEGFVVTAN